MNAHSRFRDRAARALSTVLLLVAMAAPAAAVPTFISFDSRLPNPDQPYIAEGNAGFGNAVISGLTIWATNPSQLDFPSPTPGGDYEFDSTFDVAFSSYFGIGLAPPVPLSGHGSAHVTGMAQGGFEPSYLFITELVALNLMGTSPYGDFMLRESPTLQSSGVTTTHGACYGACPAVVLPIQVSSFFDVFAEISLDGGATWTPSDASFRIVQTPEPASVGLLLVGALIFGTRRWRCVRGVTPGGAGG